MLAVVSLSGQNDPFLENRMAILVLASSPGEERSFLKHMGTLCLYPCSSAGPTWRGHEAGMRT